MVRVLQSTTFGQSKLWNRRLRSHLLTGRPCVYSTQLPTARVRLGKGSSGPCNGSILTVRSTSTGQSPLPKKSNSWKQKRNRVDSGPHQLPYPCNPLESRSTHNLPSDHLLSLVCYNVFLAFISIIHTLNLDLVQMCHPDYTSPFAINTDTALPKVTPPMLHPTILQRTVPHHPMLDIFPSAQLRDNMLTKGQYHRQDGKLCVDLVGNGNFECDFDGEEGADPVVRRGMIVWGDPYDVANWEVGDGFAKRWGWFLEGAVDLERSTNVWRSMRGEKRLSFA